MIDRDDIEAAHGRIRDYVRRTPILELEAGAIGTPGPLTLKLEHLQHTGSFKPRGAFNSLLSRDVPEAGVVAASGGNHGAAVAYAAQTLGIAARIFVPELAGKVKIARIGTYGAEVVVTGGAYAEALEAAEAWERETGAISIHAYDQPATVAGQGTLGREIEEDAPALDTLIVAVGGGGLIGGIAAWYAGRVRLIAVESEGTATLNQALAHGPETEIEVGGIAASALGASRIGRIAYDLARRHVADSLLVSDAEIAAAQRLLWEQARIVAEPGGAAALAALASGRYRPADGERVGVLICGANTDPASLAG